MQLPAFARFVPEAKDLIMKMLTKDPLKRIKPEEALLHPYFVKTGMVVEQKPEIPQIDLQEKVEGEKANQQINENYYNDNMPSSNSNTQQPSKA